MEGVNGTGEVLAEQMKQKNLVEMRLIQFAFGYMVYIQL